LRQLRILWPIDDYQDNQHDYDEQDALYDVDNPFTKTVRVPILAALYWREQKEKAERKRENGYQKMPYRVLTKVERTEALRTCRARGKPNASIYTWD
jgi:hypothetical protein